MLEIPRRLTSQTWVENSSVICGIPKTFPWPRLLVSHFLYLACPFSTFDWIWKAFFYQDQISRFLYLTWVGLPVLSRQALSDVSSIKICSEDPRINKTVKAVGWGLRADDKRHNCLYTLRFTSQTMKCEN